MVRTEGRDILTDADRARLDREWSHWFDCARTPGIGALMQTWYGELSPPEQAYIQTKIAAITAGLPTFMDHLQQWVTTVLAEMRPALESLLSAWSPLLLTPSPTRFRHARAVHRRVRRR
jgi:hypothetical protein